MFLVPWWQSALGGHLWSKRHPKHWGWGARRPRCGGRQMTFLARSPDLVWRSAMSLCAPCGSPTPDVFSGFCSRGAPHPSPALGPPGKASLCSYQRQIQPARSAPQSENRHYLLTGHTTTTASGGFWPRDPPSMGMDPRYLGVGQPGAVCLGCDGSAPALPNSPLSRTHES